MKTLSFNANDMIEASAKFKKAAEFARKKGKPILIEANTFRLRGHEEASGTKYYPEGMIAEHEKKEPMALLRSNLQPWGVSESWIDEKLDESKLLVDQAFHEALALPNVNYDRLESINDLFAEFLPTENIPIFCIIII